jgi:hypothetical protein
MTSLLHLRFRGDYYEIAYDFDSGSITEVTLFPCDGRRGEPLDYFSLPPQLQNLIHHELSRLNVPPTGCDEEGT